MSPDRALALLAEHGQRVSARLAGLRGEHRDFVAASRDSNADDEHDPEGATIAFERSQVGALIRQAERDLAEVAAARLRVESGTYGVCEGCGARIGEGRLEARPAARTCLICAGAPGGVGGRS